MDRGFLFGDGVYEVIPVYHQKLFQAKAHVDRLFKSLQAIQLDVTMTVDACLKILEQLKNQNSAPHQTLYLQITRGAHPTRQHAIPQTYTPTIFATSTPLTIPSIDLLEQGIKAITLQDTRHHDCFIKATNLLPNILLHQQALNAGVDEAILIYQDQAHEATTSNLFLVKNNILYTPPATAHILGGITRQFILDLGSKHKITVQEQAISQTDLYHADELWLCSSTKMIRPVIRLDQKPVGNGQAGKLWRKMISWYQENL